MNFIPRVSVGFDFEENPLSCCSMIHMKKFSKVITWVRKYCVLF